MIVQRAFVVKEENIFLFFPLLRIDVHADPAWAVSKPDQISKEGIPERSLKRLRGKKEGF